MFFTLRFSYYLCNQEILNENNMNENYFIGLYGTRLIARFIDGPISENQIEAIKDSITRYCESKIDELPLSDQEKEEQKYLLKLSVDVYNHGIKDGLRIARRLI